MLWIIKFYCNWLRYVWSAIRHKDSILSTTCEHEISEYEDILPIVQLLYRDNFQYSADGTDKLFDSMDTPAQAYIDMLRGRLKDDCDGYHAAIYWILAANSIPCRLYNIVTKEIYDSHTVLVFRQRGGYRYVDYDIVSDVCATQEELDALLKANSFRDQNKGFIYTNCSYFNGKTWMTDFNFFET